MVRLQQDITRIDYFGINNSVIMVKMEQVVMEIEGAHPTMNLNYYRSQDGFGRTNRAVNVKLENIYLNAWRQIQYQHIIHQRYQQQVVYVQGIGRVQMEHLMQKIFIVE